MQLTASPLPSLRSKTQQRSVHHQSTLATMAEQQFRTRRHQIPADGVLLYHRKRYKHSDR